VPTAVALRPRSFSELFDAGFMLAREHFRPLATLSAIIAIPAIVLGVVNVALFGPGVGGASRTGALVQTLPLTVVSACWYFVGAGALVHATSAAYLGEPIDPAASLRRAAGRAPALIGAHAVAYLAAGATLAAAVFVAFLLTMLLGGALKLVGLRLPPTGPVTASLFTTLMVGALGAAAAVLARFVNVTPVLMVEGGGALAALRRSGALAAGQLPRIVALFAILVTVSLTFAFTALGIGTLLRNAYLSNVLATLFSIPLYPLASCVLTALYYDLRIRREGFDIAWAARGLGPGAPDAAA
jgi:hypothetical protein